MGCHTWTYATKKDYGLQAYIQLTLISENYV